MLNRRDLILIGALIVIAVGSIAINFYNIDRPETGAVIVRVSEQVEAELPLEGNDIKIFGGIYGPFTVEISDSQVRIMEATCPDQYCVRQGWLDNTSSSVICLPNQAVIEIKGEEQLDGVSR